MILSMQMCKLNVYEVCPVLQSMHSRMRQNMQEMQARSNVLEPRRTTIQNRQGRYRSPAKLVLPAVYLSELSSGKHKLTIFPTSFHAICVEMKLVVLFSS